MTKNPIMTGHPGPGWRFFRTVKNAEGVVIDVHYIREEDVEEIFGQSPGALVGITGYVDESRFTSTRSADMEAGSP